MDDAGRWRLTPFYDVTWSDGPGGEHWFTIDGEGKAPTLAHLVGAASRAGVAEATVREIAEEVRDGLGSVEKDALEAGIPPDRARHFARTLDEIGARFFGTRPQQAAPRRRR